ncbi:MAG TPA: transposase [Roseateles sp.]
MSAKRRRHLSEEQWRELLGRFEPGMETVAEFCRREGVCAASFYGWRSRLTGQSGAASRSERKARTASALSGRTGSFVDLGPLMPTAAPALTEVSAGLLLRLELGEGMVLQISRP